jgi:hypothetical protein
MQKSGASDFAQFPQFLHGAASRRKIYRRSDQHRRICNVMLFYVLGCSGVLQLSASTLVALDNREIREHARTENNVSVLRAMNGAPVRGGLMAKPRRAAE